MATLPKDFPDSAVVEMNPSRNFSASRGWTETRRFKGNHADIDTLAATYADLGYDVAVDPVENTPKSVLSITSTGASTDGGSDPDLGVQSIWTLTGNTREENLRYHHKVRDTLMDATEKQVADLNKWINTFRDGTVPDFSADLLADPDIQFMVFRLTRTEVNSYHVVQWVLRNTRTVSPRTNLRPDLNYTYFIFTKAQLIQVEQIPATILFALPDGEYQKQPSTVEQMNDGRYQFSVEYWHAVSHDHWMYPVYGIDEPLPLRFGP